MRALVGTAVLATALLSVGLAAASPAATLRVTYWPNSAAPMTSWTWILRCPAAGTLPRPARACARLGAGGTRLFAPLPPNAVCTEIYGGPQKARVVGTVNGRHVRATFLRTSGCEIDRWRRISPWLVPRGGAS